MKKTISILMSLVTAFIFCIEAAAFTSKIPISSLYQTYCWEMENEYNVAAPLLMSIIYQESKGDPDAKNGKHVGLTQLNPKWFKDAIAELEITDVSNPYQNIKVCAYTLASWFEKYGDADVYLIVEMWNEGEDNAYNSHNPRKPSKYARSVVNRAEKYTIYYEEEQRRKRPF